MSDCPQLSIVIISEKIIDRIVKTDCIFGEFGKTLNVIVLREKAVPLHTIGVFRRLYWSQEWNVKEEVLLPVRKSDIINYDSLLSTGDFEGFKIAEEWRIKAMILRLQQIEFPVMEDLEDIFIIFNLWCIMVYK